MTLPTEITPVNIDELATLARMLRRSRGKFALAFARCNSPVGRQVLVERLRVALDALEISFQEVTLSTNNIISQLENITSENGQPLFIYGIEALLPSQHQHNTVLDELNEQRGKFQKLAHPLVFWLPEFALQEIATKASDFWAWRSGVYRFETEIQARVEDYRFVTSSFLWQDANLSLEEKNSRLALLKALEQDYNDNESTSLIARSRIYRRMGFLHETIGNLDKAIQDYQISLKIRESLGDFAGKAAILHSMGNIFTVRGDLNHAGRLYKESLEINLRLDNQEGKAAALHSLANIAALQGNLSEAETLLREALEIKENLGDLQSKAITMDAMARIFIMRGNLDDAKQVYQETLRLSESLNDLRGKAVTLNQMAILRANTGELEQALKIYQESLAISEKLGDLENKAVTLHNMANIYNEQGDLQRAMQIYNDALEIQENLGNLRGKAAILHGMAGVFVQRNDLTQAENFYKQALEMKENLSDLKGKADTLAMLAQVYALQKNYQQSLSYLIMSRQIALQMGVNLLTYNKNLAALKRMMGSESFITLWQNTTGQKVLPEWLE